MFKLKNIIMAIAIVTTTSSINAITDGDQISLTQIVANRVYPYLPSMINTKIALLAGLGLITPPIVPVMPYVPFLAKATVVAGSYYLSTRK